MIVIIDSLFCRPRAGRWLAKVGFGETGDGKTEEGSPAPPLPSSDGDDESKTNSAEKAVTTTHRIRSCLACRLGVFSLQQLVSPAARFVFGCIGIVLALSFGYCLSVFHFYSPSSSSPRRPSSSLCMYLCAEISIRARLEGLAQDVDGDSVRNRIVACVPSIMYFVSPN